MGLASHLGPWLLGTVKNTTGSTAGTIRNMGATQVAQTNTLLFSDTSAKNLFTIPAGALITNFIVDQTIALNYATNNIITLQDSAANSLAVLTATAANIVVGRYGISTTVANTTFVWTAAQAAELNNVGTTDLIIQGVVSGTSTAATTGKSIITVMYIVRNSDGTYAPAYNTA